jgi:hypothetical protein
MYMPHGAVMGSLHRKVVHRGTGMGSQLLGGGGSASAYHGLGDYEHTTGKRPLMAGIGLKQKQQLSDKLEKLEKSMKKQKRGAIRISM